MFKNLITFTTFFMAISAIGLLFFPSRMLAVVGIVSNPQADFLLRTTGAGVVSLIPGAWALRTAADSPLARAVLTGIVSYMYLRALVDFHSYIQSIVNTASIPGIAFRVFLGTIILMLMRKEATR